MLRIDRRVFDTRGCIRLFPVRSNLARLRYPSSWRDPKSSPSVAMFSPRQCRRGTKTTTLSSRRCHRHLRGRNTFPVGGARLPSRSLSRARARFERTSRLLSRIECARHFQSRDDDDDDDDASLPRPPPPPPPEAGARRPDAGTRSFCSFSLSFFAPFAGCCCCSPPPFGERRGRKRLCLSLFSLSLSGAF